MTSRDLKHFAASNGTAALALAAMFLLGSGLSARAQLEGDESARGLQGTWRVQLTVRDCQTGQALRTFPALLTFAKGGTLTFTTAGQFPAIATPGAGVWRHIDDHTYHALAEVFIFSPAGAWIQTHRLTRQIEIDNDADQFTERVKLQILDTNGNLIATGCATGVASRLELSGEMNESDGQ
jgi:hypothetical protein